MALRVTQDMHEQVRALHRAGILILKKVLGIEKSLEMLRDSCERYRKYQMYSQCIGIALELFQLLEALLREWYRPVRSYGRIVCEGCGGLCIWSWKELG